MWPAAALALMMWIGCHSRLLASGNVLLAWLAFLGILYFFSRPYPLLVRGYRSIGLGIFSVVFVVPALVLVHQICLHMGQIRKKLKACSVARA